MIDPDEQEILSFRYIAPRIVILSSGNIAMCSMVDATPPIIYTPKQFELFWRNYIPTIEQLELDFSKPNPKPDYTNRAPRPTRSAAPRLEDI